MPSRYAAHAAAFLLFAAAEPMAASPKAKPRKAAPKKQEQPTEA